MKYRLLVIDDKENICISLQKNFEKENYSVDYALTWSNAKPKLFDFNPHCIILDLMLGSENGIDILHKLQQLEMGIPVIMVTGFGSIDTAVNAMKYGAYDYIQKPIKYDKLLNSVRNAIQNNYKAISTVPVVSDTNSNKNAIITADKKMLDIINRIKKIGPTDLPVLILGENGVGKENIADLIHSSSTRNNKKMLKINCAAFQSNLLDNELFGHDRGAFTGAVKQHSGVFERADKSSLFLDEIGDMSLEIQAKILRALQNKEIQRLGGDTVLKIDTRFIAATNKNIIQMIYDKTFRNDLYFRLNTTIFEIPPLRERREDIPLLINYFLNDTACDCVISENVLKLLMKYHWPGNIRELKNVIEYSAAICTNRNIKIEDLPHNLNSLNSSAFNPTPITNAEYNIIFNSLKRNKFNKKKTAEELGISRKTLYNKIEKFKIPTNGN